jgi:nicotinamide phosphoribosyltransferase
MKINQKSQLQNSIISDTDSYKLSHWNQYVPGTSKMMSYFEARGGEFQTCTLFGLQYLLHEYLAKPITREQVEECSTFALLHGEPFNKEGWMHIIEKYEGKLPIRIRAIPEGLVVPTSNVLMTIESVDDPKCFWVVSWLETMLSRLWYPSTIATTSRESKKVLQKYLEISSDDPSEISFKLHDFGARGVATLEQARLGGAAHLLSFMGSDTIEGIRFANHYYDCEMAGFSIPATEHSTMTMWGREHEYDAFESYVKRYLIERDVPANTPKLAACVSDSYNVFDAIEAWTSERLYPMIKNSGGTLVIRPDSGNPIEVLSLIFDILEKRLGSEITINNKGFKLLPNCLRLIQGDGIDRESMVSILRHIVINKRWSASNIAFGSGGGLLQKVNRDTQKWAFKCCYALVNGRSVDVRKDPVTDSGKQSKAGRLDLILDEGKFSTVVLNDHDVSHHKSVMNTVFENGNILYHTTLDDCRKRMML